MESDIDPCGGVLSVATDTNVTIDAFIVGSATTEDNLLGIRSGREHGIR